MSKLNPKPATPAIGKYVPTQIELKYGRLGKLGVRRAEQGIAIEEGGARGRRSPILPLLNINQTAANLGMGRATLSLIINGHRKPNNSKRQEIAKALGIAPVDLDRLYRRTNRNGNSPTMTVTKAEGSKNGRSRRRNN